MAAEPLPSLPVTSTLTHQAPPMYAGRQARCTGTNPILFAPFETPSLVLLLQWFGSCDLACLRTPEHSVVDVSSWTFFVGIYREL